MSKNSVTQAPFKFKNFIIPESQIKIAPGANSDSIDVKINPEGVIHENKKIFEVTLNIFLTSDEKFEVAVKMVGLFEFKDVIVKEELNNYFYVNAPAIIFPYLRSYISALTALSGCNTIILPPMNMTLLGEDLKKNTIVQSTEFN
jgi:preprotein translocase subunit SecB